MPEPVTTPQLPDASAPVPALYRSRPVSFVRRSERLTTGQRKAWETRRARYLVDVPRDVTVTSVHPGWRFDAEAAFGRRAPLVVEIGSGQGEAIVGAAAAYPERDHLALEVYTPGLAQTIVRAGHAGVDPGQGGGAPGNELTNLRLMQVDAADLLTSALPAGSVDELWVFFPDPWHKSRHHKRRLVTPEFAAVVARALRPGGRWRLATDWAEYAQQMVRVLEASDDFRNAHGPGAPAPRFSGRVRTSFEKKGTDAGRAVTDLEYVRR